MTLTLALPADQIGKAQIYTAGYIDGKQVRLQMRQQERVVELRPDRTGEYWEPLRLALPSGWSDDPVTLALSDESTSTFGWGGLGIGGHRYLQGEASSYIIVGIRMIAISLMLLLPGLALRGMGRELALPYLPLPGILLLAAFGTAFWLLPDSLNETLRTLLVALYAILLIFCIASGKVRQTFKAPAPNTRLALLVIALSFLQTLAIGLNPLPVAQEFAKGTSIPSRMVASPPDHLIPFYTATYMWHRHDGIEANQAYFGEWSIGSRGPLVPLGLNSLMHVLHSRPADPPELSSATWPVWRSGADLARSYGWMLNTLPILGILALLQAMGASPRIQRHGIIWLALTPLMLINASFLWPKLLAAYFLLLSIAQLRKRRLVAAGVLTALAWLSHPVGALMIPGIGLYVLVRPSKESHPLSGRILDSALYAAAILVTMLPWLLFKLHLGYHDQFIEYVLGDGRGTAPAISLYSWLAARLSNLWLTLVPAAFFYSPHMHQWLEGPVSEGLRWNIQYAKTLPGHVGMVASIWLYLALLRPQLEASLSRMRSGLLLGSLTAMLIYWGYSNDGLGRNCLEALTPLLIAFTCLAFPIKGAWFSLLMTITACEVAWIGVSGFILEPGFADAEIKSDSGLFLATTILIPTALAILAWKVAPAEGDKDGPLLQRTVTS
ncbi:MAG TPA: hypothetical protein DDZ67_00790 [Xanthomonadaceae bacterium]|nr:hypothetical protein [Xanthomonadaceae bacterium]